MASITFIRGARTLGSNFFLLEDVIDGKAVRVGLDAGIDLGRVGQFYKFPGAPRKFRALDVYLKLGIYQDMKGLYRQDYLKRMGRKDELPGLDGLVISHAHLDHIAALHFYRPDIPTYMEMHTKKIMYALQEIGGAPFSEFIDMYYSNEVMPKTKEDSHKLLRGEEVRISRDIRMFSPPEHFYINGMKIEPHYVDHSLPGACGFIIHTSIGPVVYTGDFRMRGRRKEDTMKFLEAARAAKPKYLLMEGSLIRKKHVGSEQDIVTNTSEYIQRFEGLVLVSYPPRDLDRIQSFKEIAKHTERKLVIDTRQANLLDMFAGEMGFPVVNSKYVRILIPPKGRGFIETEHDDMSDSDYFWWEHKYKNHKNAVTLSEIRSNPGEYIMFTNLGSLENLIEINPPKGSILLRSHPEPYTEEMELDEKTIMNWLKMYELIPGDRQIGMFPDDFNLPQAHVTGHHSGEETKFVINYIHPEHVVPIHTVYPEDFKEMYEGDVIIVENGQRLELHG